MSTKPELGVSDDREISEIVEDAKSNELFVNISPEDFSKESTLGWYMRHCACHMLLPQSKIVELVQRAQSGDRHAIERIVVSNQRLVVSVAKRYLNLLPLMDLIQEGNLGLCRAIELYDLGKGTYFSTYAVWWIRSRMCTAINKQSHTIRLKTHVHEDISKIRKCIEKFNSEFERVPTLDELFEIMQDEFSRDRLRALYLFMNRREVSLDGPLNHEGIGQVYDLVASGVQSPDMCLAAKDELRDFESVAKMLVTAVKQQKMKPHAKKIFFMRYGIGGQKFISCMEQIGKLNGVTRERVRQIVSFVWLRLKVASEYSSRLPDRLTFEMRLAWFSDLEDLVGQRSSVIDSPSGRPAKKWEKIGERLRSSLN